MQSLSLDPRSVQAVVRSLYRLTRVAGVHALDNDAVNLAIDSVLSAVRSLDGFERAGLTFIVAEGTVIVNGQLLRAPPDVYEDAIGLAKTLEPAGANALTLGPGLDAPSLRAFLDHFASSVGGRARLPRDGHLTPHIRLRHVNAERLLGLEDERLGLVERALLTYALTALVLRQLFDRARGGELEITSSFKRLTRQLAVVDYTAHPSVLDVILGEMDKDATHRAIDTAVLSAAIYRRVTDDPGALGRIILASVLLDLRLGGLEDAPLASALAHVDLGRLRGDTVDRVLVSYEANALLSGVEPTTIHPDGGAPSLEAYILATSRRFLDARVALTNAGDGAFDGVLAFLHEQAADDIAHLCVDLLVEAIGFIPQGAAVELESGHRGIVLRAGATPSLFDSPLVCVYEDPRGARVEPFEVACGEAVKARDVGRVVRVLHRPSPLIAAAQQAMGGAFVEWARVRRDAESRVRSWLESELHCDAEIGPEPRPSATGPQLGVEADNAAHEAADAPPGRREPRSSSRSGALPAVGGTLSTLR